MEDKQVTTFEKKPSYLIELEKVYNKYLSWDNSNFPYGYKINYSDNVAGARSSVERIFNNQKLAGAEKFKQNYLDCLKTCDPSQISIAEYNGINRHSKLISGVPITIRIVADATKPDSSFPVTRTQEPTEEQIANKQMMGGVLGLMGIDVENTGANGPIGMVLAVQQQMFEKSTLINNLNQELQRVKFDLSRAQYESDVIISKVKDEHSEALLTINELEEEAEELEDEIAELKANILLLEGENANHLKNGSLQKMGIGALTNFAYNIVKASPKIHSALGITPDSLEGLGGMLNGVLGIEEPQTPSAPRRRVVEQEVEQLTPQEQERRDVIKVLTDELSTNWLDTKHIVRLLELMSLIYGNEVLQIHLIEALNNANNSKQQQDEKKAVETTKPLVRNTVSTSTPPNTKVEQIAEAEPIAEVEEDDNSDDDNFEE